MPGIGILIGALDWAVRPDQSFPIAQLIGFEIGPMIGLWAVCENLAANLVSVS